MHLSKCFHLLVNVHVSMKVNLNVDVSVGMRA